MLIKFSIQFWPGTMMAVDRGRMKNLGQLGLSALTGAIIICASLFCGWFVAFIIMGAVGKSLLVGMNYIAWPIVFPLFAFPVIFLLMLAIIPLFRKTFPEILEHSGFIFGVLLPVFIIAIVLMFATCPLENGGTILTTGWDGFSNQ